jgi:hypothetical protein
VLKRPSKEKSKEQKETTLDRNKNSRYEPGIELFAYAVLYSKHSSPILIFYITRSW